MSLIGKSVPFTSVSDQALRHRFSICCSWIESDRVVARYEICVLSDFYRLCFVSKLSWFCENRFARVKGCRNWVISSFLSSSIILHISRISISSSSFFLFSLERLWIESLYLCLQFAACEGHSWEANTALERAYLGLLQIPKGLPDRRWRRLPSLLQLCYWSYVPHSCPFSTWDYMLVFQLGCRMVNILVRKGTIKIFVHSLLGFHR